MARKRTPKAKTETKPENQFGEMTFPDIGGPDPEPTADGKPSPESDLQRQLDEMRANYTKLQEDLSRVSVAPTVPVAPTAPRPMSYDGLPDPVTDPQGYAQQMAARIREEATSQRNYEQQNQAIVNDRETKIETLWEDFETAYPEMARDKEALEFTVMKVAKKAKARGADLDRYMFVTPQKFMQDVAQEHERIFGEAEDEPEPAVRRTRRPSREEDEPTRTSVFGGLEGGGRPTAAGPAAGEGNMVKELQDLQLHSGFFGTPPRKS